MFAQLNPENSARRRVLAGSLALHGLFFAWLLHTPEPQLLQPESVAVGHNGKVLGRLYFPTQTPDDSATSSPDSATQVYRRQRLAHVGPGSGVADHDSSGDDRINCGGVGLLRSCRAAFLELWT